MQWYELFDDANEPSDDEIINFVETPLWSELDGHLRQIYNVKPKLFYSNCSMQQGIWKGWNVKYKKSGKALCTLYPKQGFFLSLVPIGLPEMNEAELLMPLCSEYTQNLFKQTILGRTGKSLAFEVKDEDIVNDIKNLIKIRATSSL